MQRSGARYSYFLGKQDPGRANPGFLYGKKEYMGVSRAQ